MSFAPDQVLAHYRLVEKIGEGGMGVVWKALDTRLGREVALKMLPAEVALHQERCARFEREARLLAALNHVNVATVHGFERHGEHSFLVMELVSGRSLDQILLQGPMPLGETVDVMAQVALGLEAAHEKGIMHRDLKPANIRITADGVAKVLDFGLAKAMEPDQDPSRSPTITTGQTRAGSVFGTAAYMSPEQARGQELDRRTDIWSFGCVLYECLTGAGPFTADNVGDTIARLLEREPAWERLPAATPPAVAELLERCMRKEQRRRLRDIGDARIVLQDVLAGRDSAPGTQPGAASAASRSTSLAGGARRGVPAAAPRRTGALVLLAALLAGIALGGFGIHTLSSRPQPPREAQSHALRAYLPLAAGEEISLNEDRSVAISPDGRHVAYTGPATGDGPQLFLRDLETDRTVVLAGTEQASGPFFSPDGLWLAYFSRLGTQLMKVPTAGGAPVKICDAKISSRGGTWGPHGRIVFSDSYNGGLRVVSADGGEPETLTALRPDEKSHRLPQFLPGGRKVAFVVGGHDLIRWDDASIATVDLESRDIQVLLTGGTQPRFSPSGHLLYAHRATLHAVRYDPDSGVAGTPFPVLDQVATDPSQGPAHYDVARDGTLVMAPGGDADRPNRILAVEPGGAARELDLPRRSYYRVRTSPDGKTLALQVEAANASIWTYDLGRGTLSRLRAAVEAELPVWMPDSRHLLYTSVRGEERIILKQAADGGNAAETIFSAKTIMPLLLEDVSADGHWLVYGMMAEPGNVDIMLLDLTDPTRGRPLIATSDLEYQPRLSPDGRWLAYVSEESGRPEIFLTDFPAAAQRLALTREGGERPLWAADGSALYYVSGTTMKAVRFDAAGSPVAGPAVALFQHDWISEPDPKLGCGDLDAQGRFLLFRDEASPPPANLGLVSGFPALIAARSPAAGS